MNQAAGGGGLQIADELFDRRKTEVDLAARVGHIAVCRTGVARPSVLAQPPLDDTTNVVYALRQSFTEISHGKEP
jgi:hypothetical protein